MKWTDFERWIQELCTHGSSPVSFNASNLKTSTERLLKKIKELTRNGNNVQEFMQQSYTLPASKTLKAKKSAPIIIDSRCEVRNLLQVNKELAGELYQVRSELEAKEVKEQKLGVELSSQKTKSKNRYKQIKRRDVTLQEKENQVQSLKSKVSKQEKELYLKERNHKILATKERYRAKANYTSGKVHSLKECDIDLENKADELFLKVKELEIVNKDLQNEIYILKIQNEELSSSKSTDFKSTPKTFSGGKFTDPVRQCCIELLQLNVGVKNVEPIIHSVLHNLVGIEVDRLPKYSTMIGMLSEMKVLAYQQLSEELVDSEFTTLHSDGTTKYGQHYGSFQVTTDDSSSYTLGLMDMVSGSSKCTLDRLKSILNDFEKVRGKNTGNKILANIKNTMSDRHVVEKSFNDLLEAYRADVLPSVIEDWDVLIDEEQANISSLNHFFCGMHLIVGMADTAAATLAEWEALQFDSVSQGAAALPKAFSKNETG